MDELTQDNIIELFHKQITKNFDDIFRASLEINAIFVDLKLEKTRRFKSFVKEVERGFVTTQDFKEKIYYNDGSPDGLLLLTVTYTRTYDTEKGLEIIYEIYKDNKKLKELTFKTDNHDK